jgi:hypothetical protein
MAENKTKVTKASVASYFAGIKDEARRKDCEALAKLLTKATKQSPKMWGKSIVGFGSHHYKYESGREGDICAVGFSSRKGDITVYGFNWRAAARKASRQTRKTFEGQGLSLHPKAQRR